MLQTITNIQRYLCRICRLEGLVGLVSFNRIHILEKVGAFEGLNQGRLPIPMPKDPAANWPFKINDTKHTTTDTSLLSEYISWQFLS